MIRDSFYRNLFVVLLVAAGIGVLYLARSLISPIVVALIVAYVLYPWVERATLFGFSKGFTIFLITLVISVISLYAIAQAIPAVQQEVAALTDNKMEKRSSVVQSYIKLHKQLQSYGVIKQKVDPHGFVEQLQLYVATRSRWILGSLSDIAMQMFQFLMIFFFVLVFALQEGEQLQKTLVGFLPNSHFEPGLYMLHKTTELFGDYLRGLVIENTILGVVSLGLLLQLSLFTPLTLGLSLLIALIIALTNVIRLVGPFIGGAIALLLVLLTSAHFPTMIGVLVIVSLVQLLDNAIVLPQVMKGTMDLHPVVSFLSVLVGGAVAGMLGMILAIPAASGIQAIYRIATVEMKRFSLETEH